MFCAHWFPNAMKNSCSLNDDYAWVFSCGYGESCRIHTDCNSILVKVVRCQLYETPRTELAMRGMLVSDQNRQCSRRKSCAWDVSNGITWMEWHHFTHKFPCDDVYISVMKKESRKKYNLRSRTPCYPDHPQHSKLQTKISHRTQEGLEETYTNIAQQYNPGWLDNVHSLHSSTMVPICLPGWISDQQNQTHVWVHGLQPVRTRRRPCIRACITVNITRRRMETPYSTYQFPAKTGGCKIPAGNTI